MPLYVCFHFFWPYAALCYAYEIKIKRNPLRELMFPKLLKFEFMHVHLFIIKLKMAGTMTMTH